MSGLENEPIGTIEVDGELSSPVARQLVAPSRKLFHFSQRRSRSQIVEPAPKPARSLFSMPPSPGLIVTALFLQLVMAEQDVQRAPSSS